MQHTALLTQTLLLFDWKRGRVRESISGRFWIPRGFFCGEDLNTCHHGRSCCGCPCGIYFRCWSLWKWQIFGFGKEWKVKKTDIIEKKKLLSFIETNPCWCSPLTSTKRCWKFQGQFCCKYFYGYFYYWTACEILCNNLAIGLYF